MEVETAVGINIASTKAVQKGEPTEDVPPKDVDSREEGEAENVVEEPKARTVIRLNVKRPHTPIEPPAVEEERPLTPSTRLVNGELPIVDWRPAKRARMRWQLS